MRISDWSSDVCSSDLLATLENRVGLEHPLIANSKHNIAELEQRMGRLEQAIGHYREAASLKEKVLGATHPSLALTLGHLRDRKRVVSGKSVSVRVELGGRRIIKKKTNQAPTT